LEHGQENWHGENRVALMDDGEADGKGRRPFSPRAIRRNIEA
jgi:hypothetical protein